MADGVRRVRWTGSVRPVRVACFGILVGGMAYASAVGAVPNRNSALCRQDLHKLSASLTRDILAQLGRCHVQRTAAKISPEVDCNDIANAPSPDRIARSVAKLTARARQACAQRADVPPPSGLGYDDCPIPCGSVTIAEDYESGVAACFDCVAQERAQELLSGAVGLPSLPLETGVARCHTQMVAAVFKYASLRMGMQRRCQGLVDLGRLDVSTDCTTYDPTGRLALSRNRVAASISRCDDAALAGLDACDATMPAVADCLADRSEVAADAVFAAVYRVVPATPTPTGTPTATPTVTPTPFGAELDVAITGAIDATLTAEISGVRISGPAAGGRAVAYGPIEIEVGAGGDELMTVLGLAPGVWRHHVTVAATEQSQTRQSLLVDEFGNANLLGWTLFDQVFLVNQATGAGDSICDGTCTLRDAILAANAAAGRPLIRFAAALPEIQITQLAALLVTKAGTMIDGTDLDGNPSPLEPFAARTYPIQVRMTAPNLGPIPADCPCTEGDAGALRIQAAGIEVRGLALHRQHAAEGTICCGDQDLVAFNGGSAGSRLDTLLLDGGAAAMASAEVPGSETRPPTGKDCVDADGTGAPESDPVVVRNSEVRFCFDRGIKSKAGALRVEDSWIHHNLRGGLFAQSPGMGSAVGLIDARRNLVEENGLNCPSGDAAACGVGQVVARAGASELSAQGPFTRLETDGNVIRDGVLQGIFLQTSSEAEIRRDYVCGINRGSGGKGILVKKLAGAESDVRVRESTFAYNDDAGAKLDDAVSADFGTDGGAGAGRNAFTQNGAIPRRNFVNVLSPLVVAPARGNQWQRCYAGPPPLADACNEQPLSDGDTNNSIGLGDRVDVGDSLAHASTGAPALATVVPARGVTAATVQLQGTGFDAVSGHSGGVGGDCRDLAAGNGCDPLRGMCVEFLVDGDWLEAAEVLGVTPTAITVRLPFDCAEPTLARVRRLDLDSNELVSNSVPFCVNP